MENTHNGHRERLREQFIKNDLDGFEPHIALELLLCYSIPRTDTNPIAHRLINQFGSLSGVLEAPYQELLKVPGVGEKSATLLKLIPSITRKYLSDKYEVGVVLNTTQKIGEYLLPRFIGAKTEMLYLVCMDRKRKVLHSEKLMTGAIDSVHLDIRKLVEVIMRVSATAVVLAHNHPQGFAIPSDEDRQVTAVVASALSPLSVELVDHIIVAMDDFVSLRESGMF